MLLSDAKNAEKTGEMKALRKAEPEKAGKPVKGLNIGFLKYKGVNEHARMLDVWKGD